MITYAPHGDQPIISVLKDQGRSYTWLAQKLNVSYRRLYAVCRGITTPPPAFRDQLPAILGVPLSKLFTSEALAAAYNAAQAAGGAMSLGKRRSPRSAAA
jgi:hypothetical protein